MDHKANCPREQVWDGGEFDTPCLCGQIKEARKIMSNAFQKPEAEYVIEARKAEKQIVEQLCIINAQDTQMRAWSAFYDLMKSNIDSNHSLRWVVQQMPIRPVLVIPTADPPAEAWGEEVQE